MNDDVVNDLKQFIQATVSQQITQQTEQLEKKINEGNTELNQKIDDLSISIGAALDISNEETDTQLKDHERRIVTLKQKPA